MPARPSRPAKKLTSSTVRVYSGLRFGTNGQGTSKVLKVSQVLERQKRLEEKKKNKDLREFQLRSWNIFNVFLTGLTALMRQKIAEAGMIANKAPGQINWEVIPENSIYNDAMDVDPQLDEWEDVFEEDLGAEGQTASQKAMWHAELQSIITCLDSFASRHVYLIIL
jgi:hypothetical protein